MSALKRWVSVPSLLVALLILVVACAPAAPPEPVPEPAKPAEPAVEPLGPPVTLDAVTGWFEDYVFNEGLFELSRIVEERSGGTMRIQWRGGPEVTPPFEQIEPLRDGVFEILNTSGAYYTHTVPEAVLLDYLDGPISELREAGVVELFDQVNQQKAGVKLLGMSTSGTPYHIFLRNPIQSLDDFRGMTIRATPTYVPLVEGLGASPVVIPPADIYTAMERGVVEGFTWPRMGIIEQNLQEVTCCILDPGYWTVRTVILMNLEAWNRLTQEQQQLLMEAVMEVEEMMGQRHAERSEREVAELVTDHNMQVIRLPEEQARRFREIAYTEPFRVWGQQMPEFTARVEEMAQRVSPAWPPLDYHLIKTN